MNQNCIILPLALAFFSLNTNAQSYYSIPFDDHVIIRFDGYTAYADVLSDKKDWRANPDKTYYWTISDTIQATQGAYSGKLLNGLYKEVFPDKNLKSTGRFRLGLKAGKWYYWYSGGVLRKISTWRGGEESGPFKLYNREGKIMQAGRYKDGILNGVVRTYSYTDSTSTRLDAKYKKGQKVEGWDGSIFSRIWNRLFDHSEKREQ